ncbi:MAG TPA: hypothetical protein VHY82_15945 [Acetobacteraceae bacterium]|jgi:rRNA maturation endonuclease Nob1|nr:hypothetical protein [Acetobacteraceae bacterium]
MSDFPDGFVWQFCGQRYRPLGTIPHVKRDGDLTRMIEWETECATCGRTFKLRTALTIREPTRRCEACRKPGYSVQRERQERMEAAP